MTKGRSAAPKPTEEPVCSSQVKDPLDVHVGKQLRRRRRALGIRLKKFSKDLSVSVRQLQRYESGSNRAIARRLFDFARMLNVAPEYFFEGYGEPVRRGVKGRASQEEAALAMVHSCQETLTQNGRSIDSLLRAYHKVESLPLRQEVLRMILDLEGL